MGEWWWHFLPGKCRRRKKVEIFCDSNSNRFLGQRRDVSIFTPSGYLIWFFPGRRKFFGKNPSCFRPAPDEKDHDLFKYTPFGSGRSIFFWHNCHHYLLSSFCCSRKFTLSRMWENRVHRSIRPSGHHQHHRKRDIFIFREIATPPNSPLYFPPQTHTFKLLISGAFGCITWRHQILEDLGPLSPPEDLEVIISPQPHMLVKEKSWEQPHCHKLALGAPHTRVSLPMVRWDKTNLNKLPSSSSLWTFDWNSHQVHTIPWSLKGLPKLD